MSKKSGELADSEQYYFVEQFVKASAYKQIQYINRGGFGAIYRVQDTKKRLVAAKVLLGPGIGNRDLRSFKTEINLLNKFRHQGIVKMFDNEVSDSQCFYLMELAEGGDLGERFKTNKASEDCSRHIFKQIVAALSYLH